MISQRLESAINAQINAEMWSAYLYLSMSAYCQNEGYAEKIERGREAKKKHKLGWEGVLFLYFFRKKLA